MRHLGFTLAFGLFAGLVGGSAFAGSDELQASFFAVRDGFGGFAILTDDADWESKWQTPRTEFPAFHAVTEIHAGQTATLLVGFSNPAQEGGRALVGCDVEVDPPHDNPRIQRDIPCFNDVIIGPPTDVRLTALRLEIRGEIPSDDGIWRVRIAVRDMNRQVEIPMVLRYRIIMGSGT